jgi:hypothetical protein
VSGGEGASTRVAPMRSARRAESVARVAPPAHVGRFMCTTQHIRSTHIGRCRRPSDRASEEGARATSAAGGCGGRKIAARVALTSQLRHFLEELAAPPHEVLVGHAVAYDRLREEADDLVDFRGHANLICARTDRAWRIDARADEGEGAGASPIARARLDGGSTPGSRGRRRSRPRRQCTAGRP